MEIWDAYDSEGQLVEGVELVRGEPIPTEYRHLVAEVVLQHVDDTYLLMKRDYSKPNYPGFWEIGAGGSAIKGETSVDAALRELKEETGITPNTIMYVGRRINYDTIYDVYLAVTECDKDSVVLQEGETTDYKWVTKDQLIKFFYTYQCIYSQQLNLADLIANISDFRILHLRDNPAYQPLASEWLAKKWGIAPDKYFESMQDARLKNKPIPQWYVAMEGYRMVGAAGVVDYDGHNDRTVTPNVCAVYVEPDCRGRGIGRALLNHAEQDMNKRGIEKLYLLTKLNGYYEKLGWKYVKDLQKDNGVSYRVYEK